ncbi:MAG: glycoside hydrolase family 1 protein, partial [Candidatus Sericytochromatia bacterium]|nr:glycoside hydrolase family 1 protein [Candidatus Tanganyikabacteria bacterium]
MTGVHAVPLLAAALVLVSCAGPPAHARAPFLWGVSTAGHQVEGGDRNSQWHVWGEQGRTEHRNLWATDSFRRYREDLDLAAGMNLSAYRFSVEWSRVEPEPGKFDEKAISHYRRVASEARARGMTPIITLFHFAYPKWLDQSARGSPGGWERPDAPKLFGRYATRVATALKAEKPLWLTINEPTVFAIFGYFLGKWPPGKRDLGATWRVLGNLMAGHGEAYAAVHRAVPGAMVSFNGMASGVHFGQMHVLRDALEVAPKLDLLRGLAWHPELSLMWAVRPSIAREVDYAALDYYFPTPLGGYKYREPWDWPVYPHGIFEAVRDYSNFFRKPVLIAENGFATRDWAPRQDGWTREAHLVAHVREVQKAREAGFQVMGYSYWSLLDNFEWGSFSPRFGLYQVNYGDEHLTRVPTRAVAFYRDIVQNDGVRDELLRLAH